MAGKYTSPYQVQAEDSTIQYTTLALFETAGFGLDFQVEQQYTIEGTDTLL